jgi:hypothetical protein
MRRAIDLGGPDEGSECVGWGDGLHGSELWPVGVSPLETAGKLVKLLTSRS